MHQTLHLCWNTNFGSKTNICFPLWFESKLSYTSPLLAIQCFSSSSAWISVLLGAPSLVQINENNWRLGQGCKWGGSWFSSPLLAMLPPSSVLYVDEHWQAGRFSTLTVSQEFSSGLLGVHHSEASYCNSFHSLLHHVEEINTNHFFWNPKHLPWSQLTAVLNFYSLQKTYCTNHRHLYTTGSPYCIFGPWRIMTDFTFSFTRNLMIQHYSH
jgi:hypothetical protein